MTSLIDAHKLPPDSTINTDVCIVGAGPAGITLATELADTNSRICLLESGGLSWATSVEATSVAEQLELPVDLSKFKYQRVGGGSNEWGRRFRALPMDPIAFQPRPWIPHSGWPFGFDALKSHFSQACDLLQLLPMDDYGGHSYLADFLPAFNNDELRTALFQLSRPIRFGRDVRSILGGQDNLQLVYRARVLEIVEERSVQAVQCVRIVAPSGNTHNVVAKFFVLACGGLENPRLLLASKGKSQTGIGNEYDLVGRYYMQHPKGRCGFALVKRSKALPTLYTRGLMNQRVRVGAFIRFSDAAQEREGLLNHCLEFVPILKLTESPVSDVWRRLQRTPWRRVGSSLDRAVCREAMAFAGAMIRHATKVGHRGTVYSVMNHMEQVPRPENRVELSQKKDRLGMPQLRTIWRVSDHEKDSLRRLHELLESGFKAHGLGQTEGLLNSLTTSWPIVGDSAHHLGTTRMHSDPHKGVTDPNCRVHSCENLFVLGGSVFPTSCHANPTLTIMALAIRLAAHLKNLTK